MQHLVTNDLFGNALADFEKTSLSSSLQKEFRLKPFWEKYRTRYRLAVVAGYLFNVLSLVTGGGLVYFFLVAFVPYQVAIVLTGIALMILELSKRESLEVATKDFLQFGKVNYLSWFMVVGLAVLSVGGSFYGSKKVLINAAPVHVAINPDTIQHIAQLIETIADKEKQIKEARQTKWKGTTTVQSSKTIESLTKQLIPLESELLQARKEARAKDKEAAQQSENKTKLSSQHFAYFSLCCELLFLLCVGYGVFYRFTSYKEMTAIMGIDNDSNKGIHVDADTTTTTTATAMATTATTAKTNEPTSIDDDIVKLKEIRTKAKKKLSSYRHRLENGKGDPNTQKSNIERLKASIEDLNKQISLSS